MLFFEFLQEGINLWKDDRKNEARGFFFLAFLALLLLVGLPILTIESINYLFGTNIPVDSMSWCAVYWLIFVVRVTINRRSPPVNNTQQQVWMVGSTEIRPPRPRQRPRNNEEEE